MIRRPIEAFLLALLDGAIGAALLAEALAHGPRRSELVHFFAYLGIVLFFKARDAIPRLPALVAQARTAGGTVVRPPWWLRATRLLVGYDAWSRTERVALITISLIVCT